MSSVVSARLFQQVFPLLPTLSTLQAQKRFHYDSYLEKLSQNLLIITMVFLMFLFVSDVFDVEFHVVCYENNTQVPKKDAKLCAESVRLSIETQAPEFLTLIIGMLLGAMFLINRIWEFCFQYLIRQHVEEVTDELNDSLYRAMMVKNTRINPTRQHTGENGIYEKPLTLHFEDISPLSSCEYWCIPICFILKNVAHCGVAAGLVTKLSLMVDSYKEEHHLCKIENRNLTCTIPEYQALKLIQTIGCVSSCISGVIIIGLVLYTFCKVKSRYNSFFKVYNHKIIPHYNYKSLTLHSPNKDCLDCLKLTPWGVILFYLEANDSLLRHYRYLQSICRVLETIDSRDSSTLLPNTNDLELLEKMKPEDKLELLETMKPEEKLELLEKMNQREELKFLKQMKQQVLVDTFNKDWP